MTTPPYLLTDTTLVISIDGIPYSINRDHLNFQLIKIVLTTDPCNTDRLLELLNPSAFISTKIEELGDYLAPGTVSVTKEAVFWEGTPVNNALTERMLEILANGFDIVPWVKFMENIYRNPSNIAVEELFLWIETANMPITPDGCFLAYKKVRNNYKDIHTGTIDNSPGQVVVMTGGRSRVDPKRSNTCSTGLHFCSKEYLPQFGGGGGGNRVVLLKINPADVVSIPHDYNNSKGRCWKYEVLCEVDFDPQLTNLPPVLSVDHETFKDPGKWTRDPHGDWVTWVTDDEED